MRIDTSVIDDAQPAMIQTPLGQTSVIAAYFDYVNMRPEEFQGLIKKAVVEATLRSRNENYRDTMRVCEMQRLMGPLATESEAWELIQLVAERNYTVHVDGDSHPEWREMIEEAIRRAARKAA